ncbi:MAG: hypothetical protein WC027_01440 [Candidatus Paceibacterota bacterium]
MFLDLLIKFNTEILPLIYRMLFLISPVVVPFILIYISVLLWVRHVQMKYISNLKSFLFEIRIPKDILKSPLAMEIIFGAMQATGAATYTEAYLQGKVKGWFSLELVSIEGQVHFYIWSSEPKFKKILEAQIYAQYPTVEIYEVPPEKDYVKKFVYDPAKHIIWGNQFKLLKKDIYPIKTYVDYGMEKDQKEGYQIDPMTAVLEFLGSATKGNQIWMQILIKMHSKEDLKNHRLVEKVDWTGEAKAEIDKIREEATPKTTGDFPGFPNPTKGQIETINAIERSLGKMSFDTMLRGFYLAEKESFNPSYISGLIGSMRQYNSQTLNGFKMKFYTDTSDAFKDWCTIFPFLLPARDRQQEKYRKEMFNAYRLRSFFFPPYKHYKQNPFILNTEELATIFHFPGNVSATPTLAKIASKKSEPPANLPIKK